MEDMKILKYNYLADHFPKFSINKKTIKTSVLDLY